MNLGKNILANYLGKAWTSIMGFIFLPYYIYLLGVEAFGLVGVFGMLLAWASLLDAGMTPTLTRATSRLLAGKETPQATRNLLRSFEIICLGLCLLIVTAIYFAAPLIGTSWLKVEKLPIATVTQAISIMAFLVATQFAQGIYQGCFFGLQKQVLYNVIAAVLATIRHGGTLIILIWVSPTIIAFFVWQAFMSALSLIVIGGMLHWAMPRAPGRVHFSWPAVHGIWKFATSMSAISFLAILLTQSDKLILSKLLPLSEFGYYSLAASVAGALIMIAIPLSQAVFPKLIELVSSGETKKVIRTYHQGAQMMTALIAPAAILIIFFSEGAVFVWSGDITLAAKTAPLVRALMLGTMLNCMMWMPYQCMVAHDWTRLSLIANIVAVVILVPAIYFITPVYGAIGAAWIWVTLNLGYLLVVIQFLHRRILQGEKGRWYFHDLLKPCLGVIAIALITYPLASMLADNRWGSGALFMFAGLVATFAAFLLSDELRGPAVSLYRSSLLRHRFVKSQS